MSGTAGLVRKIRDGLRGVLTQYAGGCSLSLHHRTQTARYASASFPAAEQFGPASVTLSKLPGDPEMTLTSVERLEISRYTNMEYAGINKQLRDPGGPSLALQLRIDILNQALDKLSKVSGPVVRHTQLPPEVLAMHQPGWIVVDRAFTSASEGKEGVLQHPERAELRILSTTGRRLADLGQFGENEVLFHSGTPFMCMGRESAPDGRTVIRLVEVPAMPDRVAGKIFYTPEELLAAGISVMSKEEMDAANAEFDAW